MMNKRAVMILVATCLIPSGTGRSAFRYGFGSAVSKRSTAVIQKAAASGTILSGSSFMIVLPVRAGDPSSILPYGVPTPDHPSGHPGIDFFLSDGNPVLASASGRVSSVASSPIAENPDQKSIGIDHQFNYVTYYTGSLQNIQVSVGQQVLQGTQIAEVKKSSHTSFHWGIRQQKTMKDLCPYDFVSPAEKAVLEQLNAKAVFHSKAQYPLVCNECNPPGGCK